MKAYYVTFRSVTYAQRGQARLTAAGVNTTLRRTPKWMENQGCSYCLRIPRAWGTEAVRILRTDGIAFRKIYRENEDGTMDEVQL